MAGGISAAQLMEHAGVALACAARRAIVAPAPIACLIGSGNNAGDGLVAARHLARAGHEVWLICTTKPDALSPTAHQMWKQLPNENIHCIDATAPHVAACLQRCALIIDALFGTGLHKPVTDTAAELIVAANDSGIPIIAADLPSGLCADSGKILGVAIRAALTMTFAVPKLGLVIGDGPTCAGRVEIADIQLPPEIIAAQPITAQLNKPSLFASDWPIRAHTAHKGECGHCLLMAGSLGKIGAGYLAARAALRSGAGIATLALPAAAYEKFDLAAAEVMVESIPDGTHGFFSRESLSMLQNICAKKSALVLGPGIGREAATIAAVQALLPQLTAPLVLDADALFAIAQDVSMLKKLSVPLTQPSPQRERERKIVITPHPGEMATLCHTTVAAIQEQRVSFARGFATTHRVWVVLKGNRTIIAAPDGVVTVNPTGNAGMATAGSGDVLAGILGGLLAQGIPFASAITAGVYLHGLAGDMAAQCKTPESMLAGDIIEALPDALRLLHTKSSEQPSS